MSSALQFEKVSAGYKEANILNDISFSIPKGSFSGVIGPNGSGKTTLLRTATGMIKPSSGTVRLFGSDVSSISADKRASLIGVVPQSLEVPMAFTAEEIVMIGRTASLGRWGQPDKKDRQIAERSMVYTDVIDIRHKLFTELSGGERQRVVVAMVLTQQPEIILLDEATSHLDINHRLEIMQIVERLNTEQNTTIIMVSHDLDLAAEFCGHLLLLNKGHLHSDGPPSEVLSESILRKVYDCDITVSRDASSGSLNIIPTRRLAPEHSGRGKKIHIIAGGGCCDELMRRLSICEYSLTCGVLNEQDSDADIAAALDISTILEKPFSPISNNAIRIANDVVSNTNAVVISEAPFGSGNLANLELAEAALELGKPVFIKTNIQHRDYTPGKAATEKVKQMIEKGASEWTTIAELLTLLPKGS
ncbi:ABC transporter [bacterium E08(2017)]|nr:ABC transporter [bacterium E08(2017)]